MSEVPRAAGELLSAAGDCRSIVQLTVQPHVANLYINLRQQRRRNRKKLSVLTDKYFIQCGPRPSPLHLFCNRSSLGSVDRMEVLPNYLQQQTCSGGERSHS